MTDPQSHPNLYEGERLEEIAGYPTLYRYLPASRRADAGSGAHADGRRPLMVFIPGAAHLARIAYGGHAGYNARDFLATWLNEAGYDVLGISYPLEMYDARAEVMPPHFPDFGIPAWGEQAARTTRKVMDEHGLGNEVVVLGWSMGGRILKPFVTFAQTCGLDIKLFVAIAGTPAGIMGVRAVTPKIHRTAAGYGACAVFEKSFVQQIRETQEREGLGKPAIFESDVFFREYFGHTPVRLGSWGLTYCEADDERIDSSGFVADEWDSLRDGGPSGQDYNIYPFVGAIRPTSASDVRHVLTDSATWGLILTLKLTADLTKVLSSRTPENEDYHRLLNLVYSAPTEMIETVTGNHFFFIGETGARRTANAIVQLLSKMEKIQKEMAVLLARLKD
jgi:hypothetical protein